MATKIQIRRGTAAEWTAANPTLSTGELGFETDTNLIKVGDGATAWNSLVYLTSGGTSIYGNFWFGDGSDGDLTASSGDTVPTADMQYNDVTLTGTARLLPSEYRIFVNGTLDLSGASAGAISFDGSDGQAGSAGGGGANFATPDEATDTETVGGRCRGGPGSGSTPSSDLIYSSYYPVVVNRGGNGGDAGETPGANAGFAVANDYNILLQLSAPPPTGSMTVISGGDAYIVGAGIGGGGGAGGSGDGIGGGGGESGGWVEIYARKIRLSAASTPAGVISANGGSGGDGQDGLVENDDGCGGGGGGSGGVVRCIFGEIEWADGSTLANAITANGGDGGDGGDAGPGVGMLAGDGGYGGGGGIIHVYIVKTDTRTNDVGTAPVANSGQTGGTGEACGVTL